VAQYRIYCFDGAGRVGEPEWLDAASDETAIGAARAREAVHELWQDRRLVMRQAGDRSVPIARSSGVPARRDAPSAAAPGP
jgi:hypothetical protein